MNLHLYYCPGTCSFVPHVMLELVKESNGQDFGSTMITLRNGEHLKPEYQAINPRSQSSPSQHLHEVPLDQRVRQILPSH